MDLAAIIIIVLTFISAIIFFMVRYIMYKSLVSRSFLLSKFNELKIKNLKLQEELENILTDQINTVNSTINTDFTVYLEGLKDKIQIEYSDAEYAKLKNLLLNQDVIIDYQEKFKYHQDIIISLRQEIRAYKNSAQIMPTDMKLG